MIKIKYTENEYKLTRDNGRTEIYKKASKMKPDYDLLIVGATSLAAGIVKAHPELSIVIIENTSMVAAEFSDCIKTDNAALYSPVSDEARELLEEFKLRKAIDENGEWLPAIQPILANSLKNSNADVYFFAAIKDIFVNCGGYGITFSAFGIDHSFRASRIIDTTSVFTTRGFFGREFPEMESITLNHYDTSLNVHKTPSNGDIAEARRQLVTKNSEILKIGTDLAYTPKEQRIDMGGAAWIPSANRGNFLAAFDDGARLEIPEGKPVVSNTETVDDGEYDIVIVGLGTAGAIAAYTAKEEGLHALVLENFPAGGGAGTLGYVLGYYYGYKGGIYRELDEKVKELNPHFSTTGGVGAYQKITEIDRQLEKTDIRYGVTFTDVIRDERKVTGVKWMQNGVCHIAKAKFVIDCTADSAACINAGCEMIGGRDSDGAMQPYSSMQIKHNNGKLGGGYVDNGRMNQYDPDAFGRGIVNSLSSYIHLSQDYSTHIIIGIAPLIGLREGYKIVGEETVEFGKIIHGGWHRKPVYYGWSNLDNHGKDNALESRLYQDWNTICGMWGWGMCLPIPMGSLIPKGYDGLLAAGRNVSVDHDVAMGLRMKDDCSKSGEAAVRLAALAIKHGIPAREVDVDELREKLFASECIKPEDEIIRIEKQKCDEVYEYPLWCDDDEKIKEGLASDAPAYYMWSSRMLEKRELLLSLIDSTDENTRTNAALALTMLNESSRRITGILIESAIKRDGYIAKAGRKYIVPRSVAAINALGRIASKEAVQALYGIMADDSFIDELPFEPYDFIVNREDYYFQYRSNIITSLCSIAKAHPEIRGEIKEKLRAYVSGKKLDVTMMGPVIRYDNTVTLNDMIEAL